MDFVSNYVILDAARMLGHIQTALSLNSSGQSLYKGKEEKELAPVAPYLFKFESQSAFAEWLLEEGLGKSWGIYVNVDETFDNIHRHFRRFLMVGTEDGKQLYFRFYDPRVLKMFLPTCDKEQVVEFFGPVKHFTVEADSKNEVIQLSHQNGRLLQTTIS